ncbi:MAG: ABC transporter ATP-binding protein [Bacteroidota bacterium]
MIELRDLRIGYESKKSSTLVLDNINARLERGKLTCFLGRNGAGKSTLLKTVLGVLNPLKGDILINGKDIREISAADRARKISAVLTDVVRTEHINVEEFVSLGRIPHTNWRGSITKRDLELIDESIRICEIEDIRHNIINELSDGQLQKVNIARAICQDTDLILLDEPTAHLDVSNKFKVFEILRKLAIDYNKSIFIITHDIELAFQNADMLWVIDDEGNMLSGVAEDLLLDKKVVESFLTSNFEFDYISGKFLYKRESRISFVLKGDDESVYWTKQALYKNGYGVDIDSKYTLEIDRVNEKKVWSLSEEDVKIAEYKSIKELIGSLNKLFFPEFN